MQIAIVTDSTAYIPEEVRKRHGIHMIPLSVIFGDESYREEIDMTAESFWEEIKRQKELPTTSQPPVGEFVELFESLSKEYDAVISIHLSSGISGTYNGAVTAGQMVDSIKVYPYDSEISCMAQGFYAIEAAKMAKEGKKPEEIIARLDEIKKSMDAYFMVDDLSHLQRGGRLTGAQALIGNLLQLKPLLHFVDKVIVPYEKIRTRKKAIQRIYQLFDEAASKHPVRAAVIHANRPEDAKKMKEELESKYPNSEFIISYFGAVIGTHLGEGAMGLCWYKK
ncbi:MAG: DegV family protein [Bacillaceae bacterium]|uniref:DegV family protein n=1 Tax=Aeribacillus TaxID=1055323 RepID=UPI0007B46BBD|nr:MULTISPECIES: DegV family protein [Aeribacillus]REJ20971.1 MAG: DegV family protein [Bacillaceae bacterium]KZM57680.1 fatty acid-binding protein DegV [Aeribacillus pallidus]MDR9797984.1 DegV family protein [Aeribacillus pallidus]MED0650574.1 DegV family protein [Aeribacillus composti]MED0701285.1 DegV family protein [Aeribacillus composti]